MLPRVDKSGGHQPNPDPASTHSIQPGFTSTEICNCANQAKHDYSCHKNVQYRHFVVPNAVKTNGYIQDQASVQRTNASQSVQSTDACGDNNGGPPTGDP
jgi:hypothetical protein